jgi:ADP-ribose pyrophosphatase
LEETMKKLEILSGPEIKYKGYYSLTETILRFRQNDGTMSKTVSRLNLDRPNASCVLLYDPATDELVMVRQFRYSVYVGGDGGWMTEIVAGMIDPDDDPENAARREVMEETGYEVREIEHLYTFYPSPGGCSEKCFIYAAVISADMKVGAGGGHPDEGEDIEVLKIRSDEVLAMLDRGEINDGKTLVALQWFRENRGVWPKA